MDTITHKSVITRNPYPPGAKPIGIGARLPRTLSYTEYGSRWCATSACSGGRKWTIYYILLWQTLSIIFQAVMDAIMARENIDINDIEDGTQSPTDPHCDILKAVSTIHRYIEDLNDPVARKMEALLASFNVKICSGGMKNTLLTDFSRGLNLYPLVAFFNYNIFPIFFMIFSWFFESYFWLTLESPYSLITHTFGCPPRGMGYDRVDCISILN